MINRNLVRLMSLSAVALVGLIVSESYTSTAIIPTKGDRPTMGFGSTVNANGAPVKIGDKIDPVKAVVLAQAHISKDEAIFRASIPDAKLTQAEYDLYIDFTYQYGINNWLASSMRKHINRGEYANACNALLMWKKQAGRDCSVSSNWGPQGCKGVWTRQVERHKKCMTAQVAT